MSAIHPFSAAGDLIKRLSAIRLCQEAAQSSCFGRALRVKLKPGGTVVWNRLNKRGRMLRTWKFYIQLIWDDF